MAKETTLLDIIQGISQASTSLYHGARDENYEEIDIGMRRDKKVDKDPKNLISAQPLTYSLKPTKGIIDGFQVSYIGNKLKVLYHSEITMKEVHKPNFEQSIYDVMETCMSFLKKEYKKITKESLRVKMIDEPQVFIEHLNDRRAWCRAVCLYNIENIDDPQEVVDKNEKTYKDKFKNWNKAILKKNFKAEKE